MTMKKNIIKKSEARILIYLHQVIAHERYLMHMSGKLDIEYGYLNKMVKGLETKGWIKRMKSEYSIKVFYSLTEEGLKLLPAATEILTKGVIKNG